MRRLIALSILALLTVLDTLAQPAAAPRVQNKPLDIVADSLEYLADRKLMVGRGNVVVRSGISVLRADYMTVQTETMDVYAQGNVVYQSGKQAWRGDEFRYNLRTQQGDFGAFNAHYDPFYIRAEDSRRISTNTMEFKDVTITTCEGDDPAVSIHASRATLVDRRIYTHHAVFYAAGIVPYFYLPYYTRSLDPHERFFQVMPGYNSRLGFFLLLGYNYPVYGNVRGITHVDYYSKRGFGYGQDFTWKDKSNTYNGIVQGYYINDDDPFEGPDSENRTEDNIDSERYRLRLGHTQQFNPQDSLRLELNYLSDPFILQDFFNAQYRYRVQPENRLTLTHRGDNYTAAIQFNKRLNDFYENVDRLPELSLDFRRQPLFDTELYYESKSTASYLEKVYPDDSDSEDYSAVRIDSGHTIFYPSKYFGFLNFIPRAGYRGTYYSETYNERTFTNTFIVTDEGGQPVTNEFGQVVLTNEVRTIKIDQGADIRHLVQLGWEGSFKAFRTWDDYVILGDGDGIRHIAEPYLDHTYVPEPTLLPDELPQFDSVDTLDERHDIKLGMRNKLQTRRDRQPVDIIDLNLYSFYRIEKDEDDEDFSDLFMDAELRFVKWMPIELDGSYDMYESEVNTFNTEVKLLFPDKSNVGLEHRYRRDDQSLLGARMSLFPQDRWSFDSGVRYDFEGSELEEHYYVIKHKGQCLSWGLGYKQVDEDEQIWLQLWLTAFPDAMIDAGYDYSQGE